MIPHFRLSPCRMLFALTVAATPSAFSAGRLIYAENFDSATLPTSLGLWQGDGASAQLITDPAQTFGGQGKSLRGNYPAQTGPGYWGAGFIGGGLDVTSHNTDHVYIRFRAKMPNHKYGLKFLKIFGIRDGSSYANTTIGLDYTGVDYSSLYAVSFGDGASITNDTQNVIFLDGTNKGWAGRSYGLPGNVLSTPKGRSWASADWGTGWHLFEVYLKFNSGISAANETNDGACIVKIDGQNYVDARGLYNRHPTNKRIESVSFFGWTQGLGANPAFDIWYDDIQISLDDWVTIVPHTSAPVITTTTLPSAIAGTVYTQSLAATGGDGGLSWTLASGTLPAGLVLSNGGVISGTPAATGTQSFTVRVGDSDANLSSADEDVQVLALTTAPAGADAYTQWKATHFGPDLNNPALSGDHIDTDGDGITNLAEYSLGANPRLADPNRNPVVNAALRLTFVRSEPADVTYVIESSSDLADWSVLGTLPRAGASWTSGTLTVSETGTGSTRTVTAFINPAANLSRPRFLRLTVSRP